MVAIPTETVYGLAADMNNEDAVKKICSIKSRPANHPLIVHITNKNESHAYCEIFSNYIDVCLISIFCPSCGVLMGIEVLLNFIDFIAIH